MTTLQAVEICAGAGGQALGLERAGFVHALAVELDQNAAKTLRLNRDWQVAVGDVADSEVWKPSDYAGVDLLAGGVPCPPFSIAGKQLGANDERDLFAWAVEQVAVVRPRALMLENVRGLSTPRFAGYRQRVLDRLTDLGYVATWKLLQASDYGVPQLRPRFVLVALRPEDAAHFKWPVPSTTTLTVGKAIGDLMGANGWTGVNAWGQRANSIGPTIVGGSKKHGGPDLGPTRAKKAWALLGVNAHGVADAAPGPDAPADLSPKLTTEMAARIQGWGKAREWKWLFSGLKTSRYRQIGNAFPPPVAKAVGLSIAAALRHEGDAIEGFDADREMHDPLYRALKDTDAHLTLDHLRAVTGNVTLSELERRLSHLGEDFDLDVRTVRGEYRYKLARFRGFVGQDDHDRHEAFAKARSRIS